MQTSSPMKDNEQPDASSSPRRWRQRKTENARRRQEIEQRGELIDGYVAALGGSDRVSAIVMADIERAVDLVLLARTARAELAAGKTTVTAAIKIENAADRAVKAFGHQAGRCCCAGYEPARYRSQARGRAAGERASGRFIWHKTINGESFFHPGWAEPGHQRRWGELFGQAQAEGMHGKALRDHFGYRGRHDPNHPSAAIPAPQREVAHPITMHMDGDVVARGTMKRMIHGLNGPATGARTADFTATRPVAI